MTFTAADIATVTPALEAACRKLIQGMQLGGPYLPVSYNRLRVQFPGNHGGVNWGGAAFNPQLGFLFVNTNELGQIQGFGDRDATSDDGSGGRGGRAGNNPYRELPGGGRFKDNESDMMCQQPPWGQLTAVNVHTGEFAWRVPLGVTDSLHPRRKTDAVKVGRLRPQESCSSALPTQPLPRSMPKPERSWTVKLGSPTRRPSRTWEPTADSMR
jgi:quinoprotein glucose dehydrogenase